MVTSRLIEILIFQKLIKQNQIKVTCNCKMMLQTYLRQTGRQIGADGIHLYNLL